MLSLVESLLFGILCLVYFFLVKADMETAVASRISTLQIYSLLSVFWDLRGITHYQEWTGWEQILQVISSPSCVTGPRSLGTEKDSGSNTSAITCITQVTSLNQNSFPTWEPHSWYMTWKLHRWQPKEVFSKLRLEDQKFNYILKQITGKRRLCNRSRLCSQACKALCGPRIHSTLR